MVNRLIKIKAATYAIAGRREGDMETGLPDDLKGIIQEEARTIVLYIEEQLFAYKQESDRRAYLNDVQFHLTDLADHLFAVSNHGAQPETVTTIFDKIARNALVVLDHLFNHFAAYFNIEGKLPEGYVAYVDVTGIEQAEAIIENLYAMNIDEGLIQVLSAYLRKDGMGSDYPLQTWQQWQYKIETINWLKHFTLINGDAKTECSLLLELVARNFNSIRIYAYCLKYISRFTQTDRPFQDQQQDILYFLKELRQVLVDPRFTYDVSVQPLKRSLIDCLLAELEYVQQREKTFVDHYKKNTESPSRFYFDIAVTLAELMFLIRVWLEIKFIQTKFKSYIYEFISNHIHTLRAENLSKKSMRNHLSSTYLPDRLVMNVRDWLSKMIAHIDLHYKN